MYTLRVKDVISDEVLITRESARLLEKAITAKMREIKTTSNRNDPAPLTIDFGGVGGVAPSFMDELLLIFKSLSEHDGDETTRSLLVANPPTRLSLKFQAVARGHGMAAQLLEDGSWLLSGGAG